MIIRNDIPKSSNAIDWRKWLLGLLALALLLLCIKWGLSLKQPTKDIIFCGAEEVHGPNYVDHGYEFANAKTQSDQKARSGKYSALLNKTQAYGMRYTMSDFKVGDRYCASIWKWSEAGNNGYLAIQGNEGSDFFMQENGPVESDDKGWMKYEICFSIPANVKLSEIKIFPYYTQGDKGIFFDDLSIEKMTQSLPVASDFERQKIQLYINSSGYAKLKSKRDEAIKRGLLQTEDDDWVSAHLIENEEKLDVKLRLKGDWTDHLKGKKWSYRIKMKSENAWNRLQVFSLQSPHTRDMLSEWVYHKMLAKEDVLTPRYDFVTVKLNDGIENVYAYEEHFVKQLPESQNRREGPIVKLSEDAVWQQRLRSKSNLGHMDSDLLNEIYNSEILPFGEGKIVKDTTQLRLFADAQALMNQMKFGLKPPDEIFDIERMAKFFAIMDVLGAHHSIVWHNLRFYYNPVTQRLEPIGFDGYTELGSMDIGKKFYGQKSSNIHNEKWMDFLMPLYRNRPFTEAYTTYLSQFSSQEYLNKFFDEIRPGLKDREQFLRRDYYSYKYDEAVVRNRAKEIALAIQPYNDFSLRGFVERRGDHSDLLLVSNYHTLPLILEGIGTKDLIKTRLDTIVNSNHSYLQAEYLELPFSYSKDSYLHYYLPGSEKRYTSKIKNWSTPGFAIGSQEFVNKLSVPLPDESYDIVEQKVILKGINHKLDRPMIIPEGYILECLPGATIDIINKSFILSYAPIRFNGKKDAPISIISSDGSGQGIVVLNTELKSSMTYVTIDKMTNLNYKGWQLTGAVTFYEADADLFYVTISNNTCEDALNMIRSEFKIKYLHLSGTKADGFDADFCSGEIRNSYITRTGNDGLDFSGSIVTVLDCAMNKIGDKGLSAGEQATVHIKNTSIEGADIGIASKDLSSVRVENVKLINCDKGFAAYKKKPEFGPAKINVISFSEDNINHLMVEEEGSEIKFQSNK